MSTWMIVRGATPWPTAGLRSGDREADAVSDGGERPDDEADMVTEVHAQLLGAAVDIVAVDGASEAFVPELLHDRAWFQAGDGAPRANQGAGGDEARELVAGVQPAVEKGEAWAPRVVGMGEDRVHDAGRPRPTSPGPGRSARRRRAWPPPPPRRACGGSRTG